MRPQITPDIDEIVLTPDDPKIARKLAIGRRLSEAIDLYKQSEELTRLAAVIKAQSVGDKLTESQLEQLRAHQENTMMLEQRKRYFRESDHRQSFHGIAYFALDELLGTDRSIKSLLNVGCNYGYMDSLLAEKYIDVNFVGVDVNRDTPKKNADLRLPNLEFRSGYALAMLEAGSLVADVCYMSSTATVIRNEELRYYLRILKQAAKYVLFSEPVYTLPGNIVRNPRDIPGTDSLPAYVQRDPLTGNYGYLCWIHNYAELLTSSGYDVIKYRFYKPSFGSLHWCLALGQNNTSALWRDAE